MNFYQPNVGVMVRPFDCRSKKVETNPPLRFFNLNHESGTFQYAFAMVDLPSNLKLVHNLRLGDRGLIPHSHAAMPDYRPGWSDDD
jgi:hypothetical protein